MSLKKFKEILQHLQYENSFKPTETSSSVISELKILKEFRNKKILDLGCGSGILTIFLNEIFPNNLFYASDLDSGAIIDSQFNFKKMNIDVNLIKSDIFEGWNDKFDIIIDDISGVSSLILDNVNWFNNSIPSEDEDGTLLLYKMLKTAKNYLKPQGVIFFPILSVSNYRKAIIYAKKNFNITLIEKSFWPIPESLKNKKSLLIDLKKRNIIDFEEKFGSIFFWTCVYKGYPK
jgi:SAM-dependent methyltransferase